MINLRNFFNYSIIHGILSILLWYVYNQRYLSHTYLYVWTVTTLDSEIAVMWVRNDIKATYYAYLII